MMSAAKKKKSEPTGVFQKVNKAIDRNNFINPCYGFNFVFLRFPYIHVP